MESKAKNDKLKCLQLRLARVVNNTSNKELSIDRARCEGSEEVSGRLGPWDSPL